MGKFSKFNQLISNKNWFIVSIILLILCYMLSFSSFSLAIAKFIVNNFASGRSHFKVYSFLIYFSICAFLLSLNTKNIATFILKYVSLIRLRVTFVVVTLISYLISLLSYFYFINYYGLDVGVYYRAVYLGRQSSTQLSHIHNFKVILTKLADMISSSIHNTYDAGRFYFENMPSFFWVSGGVIILLLLMFSLIYLLLLKKQKRTNFILLLYVISSFSVIKNIFDGGFFHYENLLWFSVFLSILFLDKDSNFFKYLFKFSLIVISPSILLIILLNLFEHSFIVNILSNLIFVILIFCLFNKKFNLLNTSIVVLTFLVFVIITSSLFSASYYKFSIDPLVELHQEVNEGATIYSYHFQPYLCSDYVYEDNYSVVCKHKVRSNSRFNELIGLYGQNIPLNFHALLIKDVNCVPDYIYNTERKLLLIDGVVGDNIVTGLVNVTFGGGGINTKGFKLYSYNITAVGCIPNYPDLLQNILYLNGLNSYILLN